MKISGKIVYQIDLRGKKMLKGSNFTKKIFLRKIFVHLFSLVLILVSIETGRECIAQNQAREENFVFSEKGTSTGVVLDSSGWKNIVEENHSDSWMKAGQEAESRADGTFSENIPADNFSSRETVDGNLLSGSRESASQVFSENFGSDTAVPQKEHLSALNTGFFQPRLFPQNFSVRFRLETGC